MTREEIKETYSMRDILARYGFNPNRAGFIRCPFHEGDREASLKIYPHDYHCFGCGANGDIFDFVMRMEGVSFREAFRELGGEYEHSFRAYTSTKRQIKKKAQTEQLREELQGKIQRVCRMITAYQNIIRESDPLSSVWTYCVNNLQYQLYLLDVFLEEGEKIGI